MWTSSIHLFRDQFHDSSQLIFVLCTRGGRVAGRSHVFCAHTHSQPSQNMYHFRFRCSPLACHAFLLWYLKVIIINSLFCLASHRKTRLRIVVENYANNDFFVVILVSVRMRNNCCRLSMLMMRCSKPVKKCRENSNMQKRRRREEKKPKPSG